MLSVSEVFYLNPSVNVPTYPLCILHSIKNIAKDCYIMYSSILSSITTILPVPYLNSFYKPLQHIEPLCHVLYYKTHRPQNLFPHELH